MVDGVRNTGFLVALIPNLAAGLPAPAPPAGVIGLLHARSGRLGTKSQTRPDAVRSLPFQAIKSTAYFHDFYNRVHLAPLQIDFGAIGGNVAANAAIWNAYLSPITLSSIVGQNLDGVSINGPNVPRVLKALESANYSVSVAGSGLPVVAASFTFNFSDGTTLRLPITATRAKLWPYGPNWSNGYNVTLEYKTDMTVSRSGMERRRALRMTARKTIEFTALVRGEQQRAFNRLMLTWQNRTFYFPEITRRVNTITEMAAGTSSVTVDGTANWLIAGQSVMLIDGQTSDLRRVETVIGEVVTFASKSVRVWPTGTRLHPALEGNIAAETAVSGLTNAVSTVAILFEVRAASELPLADTAPEVLFNGREVFLRKPNWAQPVETTHSFPSELLDYGRGTTTRYRPIDFQTRFRRATFLGRNSVEVQKIEDFFRRMKGQRGEFYMPTGENDLPLKLAVAADTNTIRTQGIDVVIDWLGDRVNKAIRIQFEDGRQLFAKVLAVGEVNDSDGRDSLIYVESRWPFAFNPSEVTMISWMPLWRHATDLLSIEWVTDSVAQIALSLRTLPDLAPEFTPSNDF